MKQPLDRLGSGALTSRSVSTSRFDRRLRRWAFRADAAFARPAIYEALETRGVGYAIRIPANKNLELAIEDVLFRSPGRPSRKPLVRYKSFHYQADSWITPRRVVAKVEHHVGELFPRVGFIVTNLPLTNRAVVRFYNKRGTAEQWIKEGKQAAHWTRLSCHRLWQQYGQRPGRAAQGRARIQRAERPRNGDGARDRVDGRVLPDRGRAGGCAGVRGEAPAPVPRAVSERRAGVPAGRERPPAGAAATSYTRSSRAHPPSCRSFPRPRRSPS